MLTIPRLFQMFKIILLVGLLLLVCFPVYAQENIGIIIDQINNEGFPQVEVYISILDAKGFPIKGIPRENLSISEDGQVVGDFQAEPVHQQPLAVVLVVDLSRSMGYGSEPTAMQNSIQAAKEFVASLGSQDQVALVTFSDDVSVLQDLTVDKNRIHKALDGLEPVGDTALNDGLSEAVRLLEDRSSRAVIVLLTDGVDSGLSEVTFDEAVDSAIQARARVFPIAWSGANSTDLKKLAELTQAELLHLPGQQPDITAYQAAFQRINTLLPDLRLQYKLQFTSVLLADNAEHELVVKVDHLGRHAEASRHFVATPGQLSISLPDYEEGQTVGGKIRFAPQVTSPAPLANLEIFMDGSMLTNLQTPPFEYIWDSSAISVGAHEFTFVAEDSAGNKGETTLHLSVQAPVTIDIKSPLGGETITEAKNIAAEINSINKIARVEFWLDGKSLGSRAEEPYELEWDLADVSPGQHEIKVTASDVNGAAASAAVNVNVAIQQGFGLAWFALLAALAVAAIIIPAGLRRRKQMQATATSKSGSEEEPGTGIPSPANGKAVLNELEGLNPDQVWPLTAGEFRLGRKRDENDVLLKGLRASRRHAVISLDGGQYVLSSLNPENPVIVNDIPVQQHILQNGDIIRAGETVLRYELRA